MRSLSANKGTRCFEHTTKGHNKFWNVTWHWKPRSMSGSVKVGWGAIGCEATEQTKDYLSAGALENFVDKKVREKLAKGYKETGTTVTKTKKYSSHKTMVEYYKALCDGSAS